MSSGSEKPRVRIGPEALVGVDTETFLIYPGCRAPELVCVSYFDGKTRGLIHHADEHLFGFLFDVFANAHTTWANAPFDLAVLMSKFPKLIRTIFQSLDDGRIHDIQTREKLIDLGRGSFRFEEDEEGKVTVKSYSLQAIGIRRQIGKKQFDQWRMRYHELWDKPLHEWPREACYYAMTDADLTYKIHRDQEGGKNLHDEPPQVRAHTALHLASCYGIRTDRATLDELEDRVRAGIVEVKDKLIEAKLVKSDGKRDTKAAVRRMLKVAKDRVVLTVQGTNMLREGREISEILKEAYEKGKLISVAEEACLISGDEVLRDYSKYTKLANILSGSVKHLRRGQTLPIQTNYQVLMETGRTSSGNPNIQNLRRAPGVRECFIPREGCVFVDADYGAAELHTLAQACIDILGESQLAVALNDGLDPHLWFGSLILSIEYPEAQRRIALEDDSDPLYLEMKEVRQLAKIANFGFSGGCSARRFVAIAATYDVDIEPSESQRLRMLWFQTWPEMQRFFDHVSNSVDSDGWYFVDQPRSHRFRARTTYCSACNSFFQGLAADGAKAALYEVTRRQFVEPASALYGTAALAFVHDEIIVECPEDRCHEVAMELEKVMAEQFNKFVPDCPTRADAVVMRFWSKKAKRLEQDGRLIPWPKAM